MTIAKKEEVVHILAIGGQSTYCGLPAKPGRRTPLSPYPLAAVPGPLHN